MGVDSSLLAGRVQYTDEDRGALKILETSPGFEPHPFMPKLNMKEVKGQRIPPAIKKIISDILQGIEDADPSKVRAILEETENRIKRFILKMKEGVKIHEHPEEPEESLEDSIAELYATESEITDGKVAIIGGDKSFDVFKLDAGTFTVVMPGGQHGITRNSQGIVDAYKFPVPRKRAA